MRAPRSLGNLRGSLPNSLHRSHFPTTGLALARTDRRSHHRRRHPRPFGPQCPSHRDARRVHAKKPQPTQGSKPAMIPIFYIRKQGQRGCCPFPLHPKSPPNLTFASLRTIRSCLTIPNTYSTITMPASLRSDCCSPSLRNAVRLPSGIDVHLHRNTQAEPLPRGGHSSRQEIRRLLFRPRRVPRLWVEEAISSSSQEQYSVQPFLCPLAN